MRFMTMVKASERVRLSRGKLTVTDGPSTEAKEIIGGYDGPPGQGC